MADDLDPVFETPRQQLLRDVLLYGGGLGVLLLIWVETGRPALAATPVTLAAGGVGATVGAILVAFEERIPWPESRIVRRLVGAVLGVITAFVGVRLSTVLPEVAGLVGITGLLVGALFARVVRYVR